MREHPWEKSRHLVLPLPSFNLGSYQKVSSEQRFSFLPCPFSSPAVPPFTVLFPHIRLESRTSVRLNNAPTLEQNSSGSLNANLKNSKIFPSFFPPSAYTLLNCPTPHFILLFYHTRLETTGVFFVFTENDSAPEGTLWTCFICARGSTHYCFSFTTLITTTGSAVHRQLQMQRQRVSMLLGLRYISCFGYQSSGLKFQYHQKKRDQPRAFSRCFYHSGACSSSSPICCTVI